jgi:probable phosphoglycerate mutase
MSFQNAQARHDVVLIRHGQTGWSEQRRHTGRSDVPLTDLGRQHARSLGASLAGIEFAAVFASPLAGRLFTLDTAAISILGWEREQRVISVWDRACEISFRDVAR